ncbi:hypothetical protein JCGZ_03214 [Jatropha curcas]|uniref:Aminotransferase-like plant mobile domain-containing protein n=1 Tax=Jatropha curcas TaxID=180498 RepID=A0A067LAF5_JATCU|nr:hypothetical protein JCGZ_03214 [Jatropha curcas]
MEFPVWSYEYCIYPGGPSGDSPVESRRIPRYLAHCHHTYASGEDPEYWRSFLNDRELSDLSLEPWDCEAWRTYPGREVWSYEYCIYPGGPNGDSPVESRRIPRYLAHCHHTYASGEDPEYWRSFLNDRELSDLSLEPWDSRLIPIYGSAVFQSRSRRRFDFGDNPTIRWTCPWWRIRLAMIGSMNLNYVLYASLDRSMAYFPDRISRQYGMIQRVPRVHNFESGLITSHLLTNLADRWQSRNTIHLDEGIMQDTVTPAYADWFFTPQ